MGNDLSSKSLPPERGKGRGLLANMSGHAKLSLLGGLLMCLLTLGFLFVMNAPVQAFVTKGASCSAGSCHGATNTAATITTSINGTPGTSITVTAGSTIEVDWFYTSMLTNANRYSGTNPEIAIPANWTIAAGTANTTGLTGWNTAWNATDGATWNTSYSTASEFPNSPQGFSTDYTGTSWDNGSRNAAFDDGTAGDLDGTANRMGSDARITIPSNTPAGTYNIVVLGIGHDAANAKAHVEQVLTITVQTVAKQTPTINTWPTASAITYGQALSSSTLSGGSASVPGTFAWITSSTTPAVGAPAQAVRFTPTDTVGYNTVDGTVPITVNRAALTVTASSLSKTYGSANPALTVAYAGFVLGDTASSLTTQPTATTSATGSSPAGTYATVPSGGASNNYNFTYVNGTLTVNKAPLTVTSSSPNKTYGSVNPALTLSYSGFVLGETASNLTTQPTATTAATVSSPAGTYATVASGGVSNNYSFTYVDGTLTVNQAALTVTANDAGKTYGAANPTLAVSYSGFVLGETASNLTTQPTASTAATASSVVGTYPITANEGVSSNYSFTYVPGTLTVNKTMLTVTADDKSKSQGTANPPLTVSYVGFVLGETASNLATQPTATTTAIASSPVGTYPITPSGGVSSNYDFNYVAGTLTVTDFVKLDQTITFAAPSAKTYGDTDFNPGATASSGLPVSYTSSNTSVATIVGGLIHIVGAGTTTITANQAGDATYNAATPVPQTLTVNTKTLTVTAGSAGKTYGAANPALSVAYSGFVGSDTAASLTTQPTATTAATTTSPAGIYSTTASGGVSNNYSFNYVAGTLTINKAALTVTANASSKTYGSANPLLTVAYTGFVAGDTAASLISQATATTTATTTSAAGTYPITASGATSDNYNFTYVAGTLTVNKATLTVTANNASKVYGASNPVMSVTYAGFVNGDTAASLATQPTASTTVVVASPVGNYPITAAGGASNNYNFTYVAGTLTVDRAPLTVTASNAGKTYGAANPALTVAYTGFVAGDTAASLTSQATATTTATITSGAGTYPITAAGAVSNNYNFTYVAGTLTVDKAPLTVTASNAGKIYGSANPALTVAYTGFVAGDTAASLTSQATATTTATITSGAGTYPITAAGAAGNNYNFTYVAGTLTVDKAILTVTADDKTRAVGAPDPEFTASYSGFVAGDTSAVLSGFPILSTTATETSPVGTYPITPVQGTLAAANYDFTFVNGTLTVEAASVTYPLTVSIAGAGSVHSSDGFISCTGTTGCSYDYASGTIVTLTATASNSTFTGWSGACTGTAPCVVTMDAIRNVTATFDSAQNVRIGSNYYLSIQSAYNAANDGATLEVRDQSFMEFMEDILFNRPVTVILDGGKDAGWNSNGFSSVSGSLTISDGTVDVRGLVIR